MGFRAGIAHNIISTHALREEGDPDTWADYDTAVRISTHALREEGDVIILPPRNPAHHFYPRPPRGGRHGKDDEEAIQL